MNVIALPEVGSFWRHHSGRFYQVLMVTNTSHQNPDYPATIVYQSVVTKALWSRPVTEWYRSFQRSE